MQTIVDVNSVEKSYGLTQVINHCSFKIYEGEIYGLLGINVPRYEQKTLPIT